MTRGLNDPQRAAVEYGDGPLLVFAGAGSGKTRVITHRIGHLVGRLGVPASKILAVTFTNRAAGEMKERLTAMIGEEQVKGLRVGTFHSMCAGMLRGLAAHIDRGQDFVIYDDSDQDTILKSITEELRIDKKDYPPSDLARRIQVEKQQGLSPDELEKKLTTSPDGEVGEVGERDGTFLRVWRRYEQWMHSCNALDFEDLIVCTMRLAEQDSPVGERLRSKFSHVLVDEYQDTNVTQYRLVRALAGTRNVCVVGDDDQCFPAGTLVATPSGSKRIELIEPGDRVRVGGQAMNESAVVASVFRGKARFGGLVDIETEAGRTVRCTAEHRVFVGVAPISLGVTMRAFLQLGPDGVRVRFHESAEERHFDTLERAREFLQELGVDPRSCPEVISHVDDRPYSARRADSLTAGAQVLVLWDERRQQADTIKSVRRVEAPRPDRVYEDMDVYDLHVPGAHTYFANEILVHNSIYAWRGADVRNIRRFREDYPDAKVVKLEENYRSTKRIVASALGVISKSELREPKNLWTSNEEGEPVQVVELEDEREEAIFVAKEIQAALKKGESPVEMAILYRTHAQARALEEEFTLRSIPYHVIGGLSYYDRTEIKDAIAYLRLVHNPYSDVDLLRVINTPSRGVGPATLRRLSDIASARKQRLFDALEPASIAPEIRRAERENILRFRQLISRLRASAKTARPTEVLTAILNESGYRRMWQQDVVENRKLGREAKAKEAEDRVENLDELVSGIATYEKVTSDLGDAATLRGYLERVALITSADERKNEDRVAMQSIHACVSPDTIVETPMGLLRIRELGPSGVICSEDGEHQYDSFVSYENREMLRITTKRGYEIEVTTDHGLQSWNGDVYCRTEAKDIKVGQFLRLRLGVVGEPEQLAQLPPTPERECHARAIRTPSLLTEDVAEFLGLMVGDGTVYPAGCRLLKRHLDVTDRFAELGEALFGFRAKRFLSKGRTPTAEFNSTGLAEWLMEIGGLAPHLKDVPSAVLRSPLVVQAKFLRGLFEDGTVNIYKEKGLDRIDHVTLATSRATVAKTVQTMLLRFGIISTRVRITAPSVMKRGCEAWRVIIYGEHVRIFREHIGFVSAWKRERLLFDVGDDERSRVPVSRASTEAWEKSFTRQNARWRGYLSRNTVRALGIDGDALRFHHDNIVKIEPFVGPAMCVAVDGERFLQNGFDGWNSKGLEFNRLFIVGVEDNKLPLRGGSASADEIEEERRLAYVAITRARKRLFLSYAKTRRLRGEVQDCTPSRFLADLPEGAFVRVAPDPPAPIRAVAPYAWEEHDPF